MLFRSKCESRRDILEAPAWKQYIDAVVTEKSLNLVSGLPIQKRRDNPLVPAGAIVHDVCWGNGQVVALIANFPEHNKTCVKLPYLMSLPDEVSHCADGQTLLHDRFGEGTISGYVVVFKNQILSLSYPDEFRKGTLTIV